MLNNSVDLGKAVDAKDLFDALVNSDYMKNRGYGILYAHPYYDENQTQIKKGGVTIAKGTKGKINRYGLCYEHENELLYVHIRIEIGTTTEFSYNITMGDEKIIEADLVEFS
ncbi:hypothetical protein MYX07_06355 [Patescibacteria group bacterium AH-259-L07]|nr:hypothetical protein [Patescibacteria group bacterium AH-259-L07]